MILHICNIKKNSRHGKWTCCVILTSTLDEVKELCENTKNGFANPAQFINFVLRKELDRKMK